MSFCDLIVCDILLLHVRNDNDFVYVSVLHLYGIRGAFLLAIYVALLPKAVQAGFRTRHVATVVITTKCNPS